jgi:hypothetical protein
MEPQFIFLYNCNQTNKNDIVQQQFKKNAFVLFPNDKIGIFMQKHEFYVY